MERIITVADGYNGHTVRLYMQPVLELDGGMVRLRCVDEQWMIRWVRVEEYQRAVYNADMAAANVRQAAAESCAD